MESNALSVALFGVTCIAYVIATNSRLKRIQDVNNHLNDISKVGFATSRVTKEAPRDPDADKNIPKARKMENAGVSDIFVYDIDKLNEYIPSLNLPNNNWHDEGGLGSDAVDAHSYNQLIADSEYVLYNITRKPNEIGKSEAFIRAGWYC